MGYVQPGRAARGAAALLAAAFLGAPAGTVDAAPTESAKAKPDCRTRALTEPKTGCVVLFCTVQEDGRLKDCIVEEETPAGQGFGEAGLKLSQKFNMRGTMPDGLREGAKVRIPLVFKLEE